MKTIIKALKIIGIGLVVLLLITIGYIYSLTVTPYGRMPWQQAIFAKLASIYQPPIDEFKKLTLEERRSLMPIVPQPAVGSVDTLKITADSLPVYIFKPKNLTSNSPVIVYYHGGAFLSPWGTIPEMFGRNFTNVFNKIVVAVDYRVAPEYPFPTPVNDCYATFKWVVENASSFGGDSNQIMVAGESAGANLAAVTALKAKQDSFMNIKYQVLYCPVVDIPNQYESYKKFGKGYFLDKDLIEYALNAYVPKSEDRTNPEFAPILAKDLSGLPPAYVITCEFDPLLDQGIAYEKRLKKEGVPTQYKMMEGMLHCAPNNEKGIVNMLKTVAKEADKYIH